MKRDVIKCTCRPCNHSFVYEIGHYKPPTCPICKKLLVAEKQTIIKMKGSATCLKCGELFTPPANIHPASLTCPAECSPLKKL